MSNDIIKYRDLVLESSVEFDPKKIISFISRLEDDSVAIKIPVNQQFYGGHITIKYIDMSVGTVEEDGFYFDGDLGVNYTLNDPSDEDEPAIDVEDAIHIFYSAGDYDDDLKNVLMNAGFSQDAVNSVGGSESGMQDEYRASYDANNIAEEVRDALASAAGSQLATTIGMNILKKYGIDPKSPTIKSKKNQSMYLEDIKTDLIRMMLVKIKDFGKVPFDVKLAAKTLVNLGVDWPELPVILNSANSH